MVELIITVFNKILYQPLFNALILLYGYFPGRDLGVAIIILTLLIKTVLYPFGTMAIRAQKALSALQPKLEEIQKKYKQDKERLLKETLELYKKERINPFSGLLPLLVQLPILIALFQVFWKGLGSEQLNYLYSFVQSPGSIDTTFFGIMDLSKPNFILAVLAGVTQFFQTKMITPTAKFAVRASSSKTPDFSKIMQKQMLYFFPIFTVFILWRLPSAIGLYWAVTSIFTILQQYLILKPKANAKPE